MPQAVIQLPLYMPIRGMIFLKIIYLDPATAPTPLLQVNKGPVDYITHEARYSLSEEKLIRQQVSAATEVSEVNDDLRLSTDKSLCLSPCPLRPST